MILKKVSPSNRTKELVRTRLEKPANVWVKWNFETQNYHGVIELVTVNGEKFQISASQSEWNNIINKMEIIFEKETNG